MTKYCLDNMELTWISLSMCEFLFILVHQERFSLQNDLKMFIRQLCTVY